MMKALFFLLLSTNFMLPNIVLAQEEDSESYQEESDEGQTSADAEEEQVEKKSTPKKKRKKRKRKTAKEESWRFSIGLAYRARSVATSDLKFIDLSSSNPTITGELEMEADPSFSLELDARYMPKNSWGFVGGLSIGQAADIDEATLVINGTTFTFSGGSDPSTIKATVLYGSAVYRWNEFYLPFGINYGIVDYEEPGTSGLDVNGGIGFQLGVGYLIADHFAIELTSMASNFSIEYTDTANNYKIETETGIFSNLLLGFKYVF